MFKRSIPLLVIGASLVFASSAMAEFGLERLAVSARNENGTPDVQAGSHPYALTTTFVLNRAPCTVSGGARSLSAGRGSQGHEAGIAPRFRW